ncbi:hypothetical protein ACJX0J_022577, partial [Zea mays]
VHLDLGGHESMKHVVRSGFESNIGTLAEMVSKYRFFKTKKNCCLKIVFYKNLAIGKFFQFLIFKTMPKTTSSQSN